MIYILQSDGRVKAGTFPKLLQHTGAEHCTVKLYRGQALPKTFPGDGILVLGGLMGAHDTVEYPYLQNLCDYLRQQARAETPILALCLGAQLLAKALGGPVHSQHRQEKGVYDIDLTSAGTTDPLFHRIPHRFPTVCWHSDSFEVPPEATPLARSEACADQGFRYRQAYALQFHPELDRETLVRWSRWEGLEPQVSQAFDRCTDLYDMVARTLVENFVRLCRSAPQNPA